MIKREIENDIINFHESELLVFKKFVCIHELVFPQESCKLDAKNIFTKFDNINNINNIMFFMQDIHSTDGKFEQSKK